MRLSWYGFILSVTVFGAFLSVWVIHYMEFPIPTGLPVRLLRPGVQGVPVPDLEPLVVRVERVGGTVWPPPDWRSMSREQLRAYQARSPEHVLYFNSRRISWDQRSAVRQTGPSTFGATATWNGDRCSGRLTSFAGSGRGWFCLPTEESRSDLGLEAALRDETAHPIRCLPARGLPWSPNARKLLRNW